MNPSTEDMLNAIDKVNADVIYILPNNKNIILAAEQAKSLVEDKKILVVPSKTVPQGIAALINFMPDASPEENMESMTEEMGRIRTGQITYAVRNITVHICPETFQPLQQNIRRIHTINIIISDHPDFLLLCNLFFQNVNRLIRIFHQHPII